MAHGSVSRTSALARRQWVATIILHAGDSPLVRLVFLTSELEWYRGQSASNKLLGADFLFRSKKWRNRK